MTGTAFVASKSLDSAISSRDKIT